MIQTGSHPSPSGSGLETIAIAPGVDLRVHTFAGGAGPTVLVMGGVHGDELEGPLIAARVIRRLADADIEGTVQVIAIAHPPAFETGTRLGPDGGNLNRAFPGDARGSATERIAHVLESRFFEGADLVIDLHTGGVAIFYLPMAVIPAEAWENDREAYGTILRQFGFPAFLYDSGDDAPSSVFAAGARAGCRVLSAELGGGAGVSHTTIERATIGIVALLSGMGVVTVPVTDQAAHPLLVHRPRADQSTKAEFPGLFEPIVAPGDWIERGDVIGLMHHADDPIASPRPIHADSAGLVVCHRAPARTAIGDILFKIGTPVDTGGQHRSIAQ